MPETQLQSKFYNDVKLTRRLFSAIKKPVENESEGRQVRDLDTIYIKLLKARIVAFPTMNVSPLLANRDTGRIGL